MSKQKLGFNDAELYAIRRAMYQLPTNGIEISVAAQSLIHLIKTPYIGAHVCQALADIEPLMANTLYIDPYAPFKQDTNETLSRLVWLHEITRIDKPKYLIEAYPFYEKGFNMLIGKAGARKSLIAVDFLAKAAMASPDSKFLYIAGEAYTGLVARWKAWEQHHHTTLRNVALLRGAVHFKDAVQVAQFESTITDMKVSFVVVDTLQTVTVGMDENSTKEMGIFCEGVRAMCERLNIGILFVHHLNKQDQYRGSSVIMASADSVLRSAVDDNGLVTLFNSLAKGGKNKENEEHEPIHKRVLSLEMSIGDNIESVGVIEDASNVIDEPDSVTGNARQVLEVLDGFDNGLRVKEIVDATGISQSSVYYVLKTLSNKGFITAQQEKYFITDNGRRVYQ